MNLETWGQYGLIGLMIGATYFGIGWCVVRLVGRDGLLEKANTALQALATILGTHTEACVSHATACEEGNERINRIHRAAVVALDEIKAECAHRGMQDVCERINRVRRELDAGP